jgi:H+/Cl- antiporter ClcA
MGRANSLFSSFRIPFASPSIYRSRYKIAIIVYIVLASIIADTFVNQNVQVRNFIGISSNWSIAFFIILAAVTIMGQYYILRFVRHKSREFRRKVAAKHFQDDCAIKDYLLICGFGFLLFFSAGQSTLANSLSQSYGLATMSFYGLDYR